MRVKMQRVWRIPLLGALLLLLSSPVSHALASDYTSGSFIARDALTSSSGGSATSSGFSLFSSGGQTATGESTSSSFIVHAGFLYFDNFTPKTRTWRWYSDTNDETPTVSLAAENTAPSDVADQTPLKLRWTIAETAGVGEQGAKFRLEYSTSSSFEYAANVVEQSVCVTTSNWCYATGAGTDGTKITTALLSGSDPCVSSVGSGCGTHNNSGTTTTSVTQVASAAAEYEFTIEESGATPATVYFFRAVDVNASSTVPTDTGQTYPSLSTSGGTLTFTIAGLPSATTTSGVTTNVNTTSANVPFGTLAFGADSIAAHRLTVTTNATNGYQIFAYERQELLDQEGAQIPPVLGTNAAPDGWNTGCDAASSSGCWGYHTSASVLSGGSTRFAPNDTYAQFTPNANEVAYSATPVSGQSTDIVYRIDATNQQQPGDYTTDLVYIVTPVF